MKSNKLLYSIVILVALGVLNLVFYLAIKEYSTARYINIAGANLAIIVFWVAGIISSKDKDNEFLQYTKYPIVIIYSTITFILSILFVLFHLKSVNFSIAIQAILLAILKLTLNIIFSILALIPFINIITAKLNYIMSVRILILPIFNLSFKKI